MCLADLDLICVWANFDERCWRNNNSRPIDFYANDTANNNNISQLSLWSLLNSIFAAPLLLLLFLMLLLLLPLQLKPNITGILIYLCVLGSELCDWRGAVIMDCCREHVRCSRFVALQETSGLANVAMRTRAQMARDWPSTAASTRSRTHAHSRSIAKTHTHTHQIRLARKQFFISAITSIVVCFMYMIIYIYKRAT